MIVICIPYRGHEDIKKGAKGSLYYEYRLDFCEDWQDIDFKSFSITNILTFRGDDLNQAMLQDMLSSKAMIDLDITQLEKFEDQVPSQRLVLSTHLDEYDEDTIKAFLNHPQKAQVYKLIIKANSFAEITDTVNLIHDAEPRNLIFNVIGKWAYLQRANYQLFLSVGVYAALDEPTSAMQPRMDRLAAILNSYYEGDYTYLAIIGDEQANESASFLFGNDLFVAEDFKYVFIPVPAADLAEAWDVIRYLHFHLNLRGIAITSPYKKAMAQYLKSNLPVINTAQLLDYKHLRNNYHPDLDIYVYTQNTDLVALKYHMQELKIEKDDKILIYGSGDCAEVFIPHLLRQSYTDISLLARNEGKADRLIQQYQIKAAKAEDYDLLINASPFGKSDDDDISHLPRFKKLIDLALRYDEPALLIQKANAENLPCVQGFEFWAEQSGKQLECINYGIEEFI